MMDETERLTLEFCNKIRKKLGKKPATRIYKGNRGGITSCPVARTIGPIEAPSGRQYMPEVRRSNVSLLTRRSPIPLPSAVRTFIMQFDSKRNYSRYIVKGGK